MNTTQPSLRRSRWQLERRTDISRWWQVGSLLLAIAAAFVISGLLLLTAKADVGVALRALFGGAFGDRYAILETLVRAAPLMLTGLAAALAFRGRVWNIGAEGQLVIGAMVGYWAYTLLSSLPRLPLLAGIILFGALGGAALGWLAGFLKVRFGVDEIISTVMLNYVVMFLLSFMLSGIGPWREAWSYYQQSPLIAEIAHFPVLVPRSRLHIGFVIAILAAVLVYVLLEKTPLGYEMRAIGFNPIAARFKGTNVPRTVIVTMAVSGALAGLAGVGELFAIHHRLVMDLSTGIGYTGIIVAMLADLQPLGVILAAILFGGLTNGAYRLQITTGVPSAFIFAIQAIVLLCVISASILSKYRIRRVVDVE